MNRFIVIAYPLLTEADSAWLMNMQQEFGALKHSALPLHFTFVFPEQGLDARTLLPHINKIAADFASFPFVIRCALPSKDPTSANTFVFLVPDEGFSQIVRLHDRLYTGVLAPYLRLDIPFTPHITVGYTEDMLYCKTAADILNANPLEIHGSIETLEVLMEQNGVWQSIASVPLM